MKRIILLTISFAAALALIAACTQAAPTPTEAPPIVEEPTENEETEDVEVMDEGEELIIERCSVCHSVDRVFSADKTEEQWDATIDRMINLGAEVSDEEKATIIDWLISQNN